MTDWTRYDVPALTSFLAEDDTVSWHQVTAWQHTYELLSEQRVRLAAARAELAEAWPPEKSEAASTFLTFVDELTASMNETSEMALTNRTALVGVLSALGEARRTMDELHGRWQVYTELDRVAVLPSTHVIPSIAPAGWTETLNAQAHRTMTETDQIVFENSRRMIMPEVLSIGIVSDTIEYLPAGGQRLKNSSAELISPPLIRYIEANKIPNHNETPSPENSPIFPPPFIRSSDGKPDLPSDHQITVPAILGTVGVVGSTFIGRAERKPSALNSKTPEGFDESSGKARRVEPVPLGGMAGALPSGNNQRRSDQRGAAKRETWQIPKGVPQIIAPSSDLDRHDPGPGVIGIHQ